jgi:hypothetical protein
MPRLDRPSPFLDCRRGPEATFGRRPAAANLFAPIANLVGRGFEGFFHHRIVATAGVAATDAPVVTSRAFEYLDDRYPLGANIALGGVCGGVTDAGVMTPVASVF